MTMAVGIAVFIATLTTYSGGFVTGYSSPVLRQLEGDLLVGDQVSWFGSLTSLAGIAGALICVLCSDYPGRKACILLCSIPYTAGLVLIIAADNYKMLYAGRFLTGVGMGMAQPIASVYVGEIVSKDLQGYLGPVCSFIYYAGLGDCSCIGIGDAMAMAGCSWSTPCLRIRHFNIGTFGKSEIFIRYRKQRKNPRGLHLALRLIP